jgi:hypothetical protein
MGNRFIDPAPHFQSSTAVYSGGTLYFYVTATSTPANVYGTSDLTGPVTSVVLDSAGRASTEIFLDPSVTYKCILKDSDGNTIWTRDPVVDPAANVTAAFQVYNGNPNGTVAGNKGSVGGSGASVVWDFTNFLLYVCTTSGTTLTAVWTQVASQLSGAVSATSITTPTALAADTNNYAPTSFSSTFHMRQSSSLAVTITGLAGGTAGRFFGYTNVSSYNHTFADESSSSTAANRFALQADLVVFPEMTVWWWYDSISSRWRLIGNHQNAPTGDPGGRLTLTSAAPVLTSDVTAATTIYYTPYKHNYIRLYNGFNWQVIQFSELSQTLADTTKSPAAAAVSSNYDMFVWNDSGTLRCTRGPLWSTAVTRGTGAGSTELQQVDGTWTNKIAITNGPAANRGTYVGTIATSATGANGQMNMMFAPAAASGGSANRLDVWNMYNRVAIGSMEREADNSWAYTTATLRSANGSVAGGLNQRITVICGLNEDSCSVMVSAMASTSAAARDLIVGVGLDSTTAIAGFPGYMSSGIAALQVMTVAHYRGLVGLGTHYFCWLEYSQAAGGSTTTWYGDNGSPTVYQSGMAFTWMM